MVKAEALGCLEFDRISVNFYTHSSRSRPQNIADKTGLRNRGFRPYLQTEPSAISFKENK